ncbi:MAG: glycosyltransferase family 2 protein [Ginsengibacter sp.]
MEKLSAMIITFNEEDNIGRCIDSLWQVADEIIVLDSYSTDNTIHIARKKGALITQGIFSGYVEQKNTALRLTTYNYVVSLDADEILSRKLVTSILREKFSFRYPAYFMNRYNNYCGKFIKHGLWYPNQKVRLFDKRIASWGGINPHDKIKLQENIHARFLQGDIIHYAYDSVDEHIRRNAELSTIAAYSLFESGKKKHWSKIILSPAWSFIHGYFLRLGFLDGYYGFVIATQTASQSFLKYQKLRRMVKQNKKEAQLVMNN